MSDDRNAKIIEIGKRKKISDEFNEFINIILLLLLLQICLFAYISLCHFFVLYFIAELCPNVMVRQQPPLVVYLHINIKNAVYVHTYIYVHMYGCGSFDVWLE